MTSARYHEIVRQIHAETGIPHPTSTAAPRHSGRIASLTAYAVYRYPRYRRQGLGPIAALEACEAWDRNNEDERRRRRHHGVR